VAEGAFKGKLLTELCVGHATELFGDQAATFGRSAKPLFPLLIKLLDCDDWLSVQVHPNDALAQKLLGEPYGKTEAWVVLTVEPSARVYAGLLPGTTRATLERHLAEGTVEQCLHSFTPKPGDCVFLPAGTVHAGGGGLTVAEVQQTSDATFRLFDWNRIGSDGKPRQLHVDQALASIDWNAVNEGARGKCQRPVAGGDGCLIRCPYFLLDRFRAVRLFNVPFAGQLSIWIVLNGAVELAAKAGPYRRTFMRGDTVMLPASAEGYAWHSASDIRHPTTDLLAIRLP
jgi:mannose-6-phosphate isomerase